MLRFYYPIVLILLFSTCTASGESLYAPKRFGTTLNGDDLGDYAYDSASNRIRNNARDYQQVITMGLVTKPIRIQQGSNVPETLFYGPGSNRYLRVHGDERKTFYLNAMEYRLWTPDNPKAGQSVVQIRAKGYSPDVQVERTQNNQLHLHAERPSG